MNRADAEKLRISQDRNQILDSLKRVYPSPLRADFLRRSIVSQPDWDVFRKDVAYLEAKGYVEEVKPRAGAPIEKRWYLLTAAGVEAADEMIEDPALNPEI